MIIEGAQVRQAARAECDTVIVGSGCSGSVVASILAASGEDVVVLEEGGAYRVDFHGRAGTTYTIEYTDSLAGTPVWRTFAHNGSVTLSGAAGAFVDDFTTNTSGGPSSQGSRFYRFRW